MIQNPSLFDALHEMAITFLDGKGVDAIDPETLALLIETLVQTLRDELGVSMNVSTLDAQTLATEIRQHARNLLDFVEGHYSLNSLALADALMPFLIRHRDAMLISALDEVRAWRERFPEHHYRPEDDCISLKVLCWQSFDPCHTELREQK